MPRFIGRAPEIKRAAVALAAISEAGTFEGYASLFGVVDTANDEVVRGAFGESLQKRGPAAVKMLWQHQAAEPIGSWLSIAEDARGLKVVGKLNLAVARAREVLSLMREGAVDGLSIGFRTERASVDRKSGVRRLHRLDLWEISIVTFPALPQARVSAIKDSSTLRPSSHGAPATLDTVSMKVARLRAHLAAANFEAKLLRLSRALETRYDPNPPRVPAGSPGGRQRTWSDKDEFITALDSKVYFDDIDSVLAQDPFVLDVLDLPQTLRDPIAQSLAFCREIKEVCIAECSDASLPTMDDGFTFFNCLNACLERHGCLGIV